MTSMLAAPLEERSTASFRAGAGDGALLAFDADAAVVFAVDLELTLHFVNRAWEVFALANDGRRCLEAYRIGRSVRDAIPHVLARFYEKPFAKIVANVGAWEHVYECSSPTQLRSFRMRAVALPDRSHVVITNDLIRTSDAPTPATMNPSDYVDHDGRLVQCAHCRRCRRVGTGAWDWVPFFVATPWPGVSHGICEPCSNYHYGG